MKKNIMIGLFLLWGIALVSRWACGDNRTQSRPAGAPETGVTTPTDVESPIVKIIHYFFFSFK